MKHLFMCEHQGIERETEGICFDAKEYTEEEAKAQFVEVEGYSYTGEKAYEFDGQIFFKVEYLGVFTDEELSDD